MPAVPGATLPSVTEVPVPTRFSAFDGVPGVANCSGPAPPFASAWIPGTTLVKVVAEPFSV